MRSAFRTIRARLARAATILVVGTVAATALVGAGAGPAGAATTTAADPIVHISPALNPQLAVEVADGSYRAGAPVDQWYFTGGSNQLWYVRAHAGHFWIVNVRSGLCLATDSVPGDTVFQWYCSDDRGVLWDTGLTPDNGIPYFVQSVRNGQFLDVRGGSPFPGADLTTWYWNGGINQLFYASAV